MTQQLGEPLLPGQGRGPTRDLEAARGAFATGDINASRAAHAAPVVVDPRASEAHQEGGGRVKSIVFGGLDGILTSFAIVSGAVGAHVPAVAILAMGVSNVLADALSMGAGEWLSSRAYNSYVQKELERETWELDNYPEGEVLEMIELFTQRGMSREDAEVVITRMAKYKDFFVNLMMTEELSLPLPMADASAEAFKDGFLMFLSFAIFGMLPVLGFVALPAVAPDTTESVQLAFASGCTGLTLLGLGGFKAHFHDKNYLRGGLETLLLGSACALVAFTVGRAVANIAGASELFAVPDQELFTTFARH